MPASPTFHVIGGHAVKSILCNHTVEIVRLIRDTYALHDAGGTTNPDSYFLRFPDKPTARIIALPARVRADRDITGIKWISSFPENNEIGLPRASAVVVLNDMETGFPYACLEGSLISAARTAASAVLAAEILHGGKHAASTTIIGAGPIASTVMDYLLSNGWTTGPVRIYDLLGERAEAFAARMLDRGQIAEASPSAPMAIQGADLVVFATTASKPYFEDPALFTPAQTVLHISLRDLGVRTILSAQNVVDDIEHCMKAQTSVHLAEQATGGRTFVAGTIGDLLTGRLQPDRSRVRIFSPFGLGVLDIALARFVYEKAVASGAALAVEDFFFRSIVTRPTVMA